VSEVNSSLCSIALPKPLSYDQVIPSNNIEGPLSLYSAVESHHIWILPLCMVYTKQPQKVNQSHICPLNRLTWPIFPSGGRLQFKIRGQSVTKESAYAFSSNCLSQLNISYLLSVGFDPALNIKSSITEIHFWCLAKQKLQSVAKTISHTRWSFPWTAIGLDHLQIPSRRLGSVWSICLFAAHRS